MISHEEARALISARLDAPLDPAENRDLLGHLATCASCRQFAEQTNVLARGLRDLPQLAPSPVVSRAVLERISQGRSPWTRFWEGLKLNPAPLAAAVAVIVLLIVGVSIFRGIGGDDDPPGGNLAQLDANTQTVQATEAAENTEAAQETEATATDVPASDDETVTTGDDDDSDSQADDPTAAPTEPTPIPALNSEGSSPTEAATSAIQGGEASDDADSVAATDVTQTADDGDGADPEATSGPDTSSDPTEPASQPAGQQAEDQEHSPTEEAEATEEPTSDAGEESSDDEDSDDGDGDTGIFAAIGPDDGSPVATQAPERTSATPTPIVVSIPSTPEPTETTTPEPTSTPEPTATEEPTNTATPEPSETPELTETPEPTATATATERPQATSTPEPTETPDPTETPEPTATATPEPTEALEPTETPAPTETPEPTETATPEPTDTPEPTVTATPEPTNTPEPTERPQPTATPEPPPTEEPADDGPPPIVPVEGSDVVEDETTGPIDQTDESDETTGDVVPTDEDEPTPALDADEGDPTPDDVGAADVSDEANPTPDGIGPDSTDEATTSDETEPADDTEPADETDTDNGEPPIRPIGGDGQDGASGADQGDTGDEDAEDADEAAGAANPTAAVTGVGGGPDDDPDDAAEDTEDTDASEEGAFDLADAPAVIAAIPGPASPDGALRYAGGAYVAGVDGGDLAVVTADGAVRGIGPGYYPVWSPGGGQLAYTVDGGASAEVYVYALGGGSAPVSAPGPEDGAVVRDVPAGWSGETPVILRTDRDRVAYAELYVAGGEPFWRRDGVGLLGLVPVQMGGGFLVPTTEGWLLVDQGGGEQNLGPVAGGEVTAAVAGPNGLLAYLAGGSVWVATASNPAGAAPIAAGSGFAFAPDGSALAVTDGTSLTVYDLGGGVLDAWTPGDGSAVGAPAWTAEGIVVPVGSALRLVPSSEIGD